MKDSFFIHKKALIVLDEVPHITPSYPIEKVEELPVENVEKSDRFDWSKPEETDNEELELDWSDDEDVSMTEDAPASENKRTDSTNLSENRDEDNCLHIQTELFAKRDLKNCALNSYLLQAFAAKRNIFSQENVEDVIDALVWALISQKFNLFIF